VTHKSALDCGKVHFFTVKQRSAWKMNATSYYKLMRCDSRKLPLLTETRGEVMSFSQHNPEWQPMLKLFEHLCAEYGSELYGSAIMGGGLVLAPQDDVARDKDVIVIYFDPQKQLFSLSHRNRDIQPEQHERCAEDEIWERLRLFLAYKFGIYRKPNAEPDCPANALNRLADE
jgi:hypothetical protein